MAKSWALEASCLGSNPAPPLSSHFELELQVLGWQQGQGGVERGPCQQSQAQSGPSVSTG